MFLYTPRFCGLWFFFRHVDETGERNGGRCWERRKAMGRSEHAVRLRARLGRKPRGKWDAEQSTLQARAENRRRNTIGWTLERNWKEHANTDQIIEHRSDHRTPGFGACSVQIRQARDSGCLYVWRNCSRRV